MSQLCVRLWNGLKSPIAKNFMCAVFCPALLWSSLSETVAQPLEYYHRLAQNSTNIFHDSKLIFPRKDHSVILGCSNKETMEWLLKIKMLDLPEGLLHKNMREVVLGHCLEKGRHFKKYAWLMIGRFIAFIVGWLQPIRSMNYMTYEETVPVEPVGQSNLFSIEKKLSVPFCALFSIKYYLQFWYNCYTNLFRSCLCCFQGNSCFSCCCRTWTTWLPVVR